MEILATEKINLFFLFVIPGFISMKIWSLLVPSETRKLSNYLLEAVSYSCINFTILIMLTAVKPEFQTAHPTLFKFFVFLFLFVLPVVWPIIILLLLRSHLLRGLVIHPTPKSWDYFFGTGLPCYVIVHLKNNRLIGGLYGTNSFASSLPFKEEIYLEEVWRVNEKGEFLEKIENTKGMWIDKDFFDYLEFFEILKMEELDESKEN